MRVGRFRLLFSLHSLGCLERAAAITDGPSPPAAALPQSVPVVGLVGGVASGKSFVASVLCELGAFPLDADRAGHDVLDEEEVQAHVRDRWGSSVLNERGTVDRASVARLVFANSPQGRHDRQFLEAITHPRIQLRLARQARQAVDQGATVLVLDAPLLIEAGWDKLCSQVWFVECPRQIRRQRARQRGWSDQQFEAREHAQLDLDAKRQRADAIIDNSQGQDHTRRQVEQILKTLR